MENIEQNDNIDCTRIRTTAELNEKLITAIESDNLEQVKSLVEQGVVNVNYKDEDDDWTPLMYAVMSATIIPYNLEIIKYLIDKGADVNVQDIDGDTALKYAVDKNELNLVKLLIEHGADVNAKYKFDETALIIACKESDSEIAKFLIDNGADVNVKNCCEKTPLMYACEFSNDKNLKLVKYLIERGADVNAKDYKGWTALAIATYFENNIEIVKFLIFNGADVNAQTDDGKTPIMYACLSCSKSIEIAKLLIENGADVNVKDKNGKTLLMYAKNVAMKNFLRETIKKQKFPQSDERIRTTESTISLMNVDYSDFNQLKSEVEKHHQAIIKTMDFSLALQKKISDLQEDSFLNAQHIQVIKNTHQMQIDKIYNILRKHIINTDNFIVEFAEKYDKENKQKGFIRRFFDKVAENFGTISNSAEPNTSILKSQLSNETISQNSSECQEQDDSGDESSKFTYTRRKT